MGIFRSNDRGFRNQQVSRAPNARAGLYEARTAEIMQGLRGGSPSSIIGGQFVAGGDTAGYNVANDRRNATDADYKARIKSQAQSGSRDLNMNFQPARSGGTSLLQTGGTGGGGNPLLQTSGQPGQPQMNGDPAYPGGDSYQDLLDPEQFGAEESNTRYANRSAGNDYQSSTLGDEFDTDYNVGFANGGQVQGLRQLRRQGQQADPQDPRSPEEIMAQETYQQALASQEQGGQMHRPQPSRGLRAPGYKWGAGQQPAPQQPAQQQTPAPGGYKWGKKVPNFNQGGAVHPGAQKMGKIKMPEPTGPIGDPAMDTGEDTVEAVVRPGEVLINPPTVEYFGGGDYDEGLRMINEATMAATGEPMGAEYDEEGTMMAADSAVVESQRVRDARARIAKAEAAKLERGLKMDPTQRRTISPEGRAELNKPKAGTRPAPVKPAGATAGQVKEATRANRYYKAGQGAGKVAKKAASLRGLPGQALAVSALSDFGAYDVNPLQDDGLMSREGAVNAGFSTLSGLARGVDAASGWLPGMPETNLRGGLRDAVMRDLGDTQEWNPETQNFEANAPSISLGSFGGEEQQQVAPQQEAAPAPDPYGRAFGAGDVDLRNMNVVQNTGGPGNEKIIREDINGVPTFTNVRQGGFDGSSANLQAEADARVVQDQAIGLRNGQVVEQMRQNAPVYTQAGVDQRRQEDLTMQQTAMEAASRSAGKAPDIVKEKTARFQRPVMDAEGQVTKYIDDPDAVKLFDDTISKLNPAITERYGAPFDSLPRETRMEVYDFFEEVRGDTDAGNRAGQQLGVPTSEIPRTGVNSLRGIPGDIGLGDVAGPNFTAGDYWAGMWDGDSTDDVKVLDPLTGGQIPLRRLLQQNPAAGKQALERYGIDPARFK